MYLGSRAQRHATHTRRLRMVSSTGCDYQPAALVHQHQPTTHQARYIPQRIAVGNKTDQNTGCACMRLTAVEIQPIILLRDGDDSTTTLPSLVTPQSDACRSCYET
jgi:hypothetical protein